jgi:hypothetical protein
MWSLVGVVWLSALAAGGRALWTYSSTPGQAALTQDRWPAASRLPLDPHRPTLVMLAHPHCPCTRASIGELTSLLQRVHGHVSAHVVFVRPSGMPPDWEKTDTWLAARGIPGVKAWIDRDGVETVRFGARTSGQVLLYNPDGRLVFSGGITPIRGHLGDSRGQERIVSLVATGKADATTSRVFGCALGR